MTARHWKSQVNGNFDNAADWTAGKVPGEHDDAILNAKGTMAYTVRVTDSHTVNSIQMNSSATLAITARTFTARNGTGTGDCAGTIAIAAGGSFTVGGGFADARGQITMAGGAHTSVLTIAAGGATFSGMGRITLGDSATNIIRGAKATAVLTNVDNVISGAGELGAARLTIVNEAAGIIKATGVVNALVIDTQGETLVNQGLIEAAGEAGLVIQSTTVANSGLIEANGAMTHVDLTGVTLRGGGLETLRGGVISVLGTADVFDGSAQAIINSGTVVVGSGAYLSVIGTVGGDGAIDLDGSGLGLGAGARLGAHAHVVMSDSAANVVTVGAGVTLTNAAAISGAGHINGYLNNLAGGVIDANGANALYVDIGSSTLANAGLIETVGAGGLEIYAYHFGRGTVINTGTLEATGAGALTFKGGALDNAGIVLASGTGGLRLDDCRLYNTNGTIGPISNLYLDYARIIGGQLSIGPGGEVTVVGTGNDIETNTLANGGRIDIGAGAEFGLQGMVVGVGTINVNGGYLDLNLNTATTLSGGGQVNLSAGAEVGAYRLTNVNDTIQGSGSLGGNITNEVAGVIDANGASTLAISGFANYGLLESTSSGGVYLTGDTDNSGTIKETGSGALQIYGHVENFGTIASTGAGGIRLIGATIDDVGGAIAPISHLYMKQGDITGYGAVTIVAGGVVTVGGGISDFSGIDVPTLVNQGVINAGAASMILNDNTEIVNSGTLEVAGGFLEADSIGGAGLGVINGGTLDMAGVFNQNVTFSGTTGTLELGQSQGFTASVSGFSKAGGTSLDLSDINFTGPNEAQFSGTVGSGVLTVSDGSHTARINLIGDYLGSTFVCASDPHFGVLVHVSATPNSQTAPPPAQISSPGRPSPHYFAAAIASTFPHERASALVQAPGSEWLPRLCLTLPRP